MASSQDELHVTRRHLPHWFRAGALARKLNKLRGTNGSVWRDESFDRIVRDQAELDGKLRYMYLNPVKAGLTNDPDSYVGWFIKKA